MLFYFSLKDEILCMCSICICMYLCVCVCTCVYRCAHTCVCVYGSQVDVVMLSVFFYVLHTTFGGGVSH